VALDDARDVRESDSAAFEFVAPVQALKRLEQDRAAAHVEADAVVAHEPDAFALKIVAADLDPRLAAFAGEFHRVAEEVVEHLAEGARIDASIAERGDDERRPGRFFDEIDALERKRGEVGQNPLERRVCSARDLEHIVDQLVHDFGIALDPLQNQRGLGRRGGTELLAERARSRSRRAPVPADRARRYAQTPRARE